MNRNCLRFVRAAELPRGDWQKSAAFPDPKGYTDDTLAMNSMIGFQARRGQGVLWLRVSGEVRNFSVYVNGRPFDVSGVDGGIWQADISGIAVNGANTLQVSNILPPGLKEAVTVYIPYPEVLDGRGGTEGIRPEAIRLVSDLIESDVAFGFTGAQLAVVRNGRLVCDCAWGYADRYGRDGTDASHSAPVTRDTLFDLASVTKMFSVNYAVQKLVTDGQLDIDTRVTDILGDAFADGTLDFAYRDAEIAPGIDTQKAWKRALTVRDLLWHRAGFPASPHYNDPDHDMALQGTGQPLSNLCYAIGRDKTREAIFRTPLLYEPGAKTVYSDVDYMLLTFIVERVTGQRLDAYMRETFYAPLGLTHVTFLPTENGFSAEDCAATEPNGNTRGGRVFFPHVRTGTIRGEVHDERAWYCMEGVSGHAGLFANARDLAKLAFVMLTGGYGAHRFFSRNVIDLFTSPRSAEYGQWGLGWWRKGDDGRARYFGAQASPGAFGHQGWTGTLVMIDPSRDLVIAYLTNKVNSAITDPAAPNRFDGSCYTASTLGFVPQILSVGMDGGADVTAQLLDLSADMALESIKLIPGGAGADHPYVRNARSKIAVLRKWGAANESRLRFADGLEKALPR